ncbi:MAG: hypothetical protein NC176_10675 [Treponema brennaborense]|nr:hypothetical protein [Prevotella sp.]MCM1408925.1 hypothetical protein [Treponema brennaborense]
MKKIVSVLAIASLAAASVFAQPKISMNYRTRPIVFGYSQTKNPNTKTDDSVEKTMKFLDLIGYDTSQDNFAFSISGEKAGINFTFMPKATDFSAFAVNTYNAWMKFGGLQLAAGAWKDGVADGNYRVKNDQDAHQLNGIELERFKLGGAYKTETTFIDDMVNLKGNSSALAMYAEYTANINDDMTLKVLASAISGDWYAGTDKDGDDETSKTLASGFGFRVQFNMKDTFNVEAIVKSSANRNVAAGLYFQPKMVKNLDATIGGAFSFVNDTTKGESVFEGWNADLRARYQINDQFSISTFNSISALDDTENGAKSASGLAGLNGKSGWSTTTETTMLLWDSIGARYVVNDKIAAFLNAGLLTPIQKKDTDENSYSPEWRVTPGIIINAQGGATITVGVALSGTSWETGNTKHSVFDVGIPVVFRVRL